MSNQTDSVVTKQFEEVSDEQNYKRKEAKDCLEY